MAVDLVRATERRKGQGHHRLSAGHGKWHKTLFVEESMYKYLQTHIEVLKLCIGKSGNKQLQL